MFLRAGWAAGLTGDGWLGATLAFPECFGLLPHFFRDSSLILVPFRALSSDPVGLSTDLGASFDERLLLGSRTFPGVPAFGEAFVPAFPDGLLLLFSGPGFFRGGIVGVGGASFLDWVLPGRAKENSKVLPSARLRGAYNSRSNGRQKYLVNPRPCKVYGGASAELDRYPGQPPPVRGVLL